MALINHPDGHNVNAIHIHSLTGANVSLICTPFSPCLFVNLTELQEISVIECYVIIGSIF